MTGVLPPPDPDAAVATVLDALTDLIGYDLREALPPGSWAVAVRDGRADLTVTESGLRAIALLSGDERLSDLAGWIVRESTS